MSKAPDSQTPYQVLARKYRPMTFGDMIGQEALVTTLTNAFAVNRVAHAFMLTGVRGIGKTTTARLLARALNYESADAGGIDGPSVELDPPGVHCEAINTSSHMDVMEMDAASRTGVGDIREILDSVRYAPVSARYKVYIIDEVHMLSSAAFNALLKTLEEPPAHAKFIFATTEIRKIPITVLSRCQRFDLRRVEAGELAEHLSKICEAEGADIAPEGLAMIARAAEGSVRDGLSLLDQAIVQAEGGKQVSADQVRAMLGLADRLRVFDLLAFAAGGDAKGALSEIRSQYHDGADPAVIIRDMLDCCHEVSRAKVLGSDAEFEAAPDQVARLTALAETQSMGQITRLWQLLLAAHDEVRRAPNPLAAAEMAVLRLAVAGELPPPERAAQLIEALQNMPAQAAGESAPAAATTSAPAPPPASSAQMEQPKPAYAASSSVAPAPQPISQAAPAAQIHINSLEELVAAMPKSETDLKYDVRKFLRPVSFQPGKIEFEHNESVPRSLATRLSKFLKEVTGETWLVAADKMNAGQPSLIERKTAKAKAQKEAEDGHPEIIAARKLFPGVKIEFRDRAAISNVITADFAGHTGADDETE